MQAAKDEVNCLLPSQMTDWLARLDYVWPLRKVARVVSTNFSVSRGLVSRSSRHHESVHLGMKERPRVSCTKRNTKLTYLGIDMNHRR